MPPGARGPWPWAAFAAMTLIWGSTFLAIRVSNDAGYDPFRAAFARVTLAALLLGAVALALRVPWPRGRGLALSMGAGLLIFGANFLLLFWGELTVPSAMAAVLWGVYPTLTALGAAVFLRGEPLTVRGLAGAGLAFAGLLAVFGSHVALGGPLAGFAAILLGILGGTVGSLAVKRWGHGVHPLALNAAGLAASAPLLLPFAALLGQGPWVPAQPAAMLALAYLAAVGSAAFVLWAWLLKRWPATRVSFQTVLSPLVAVVLGAALLAEPVGGAFLLGTALVLVGTWLATLARPRRTPRPTT